MEQQHITQTEKEQNQQNSATNLKQPLTEFEHKNIINVKVFAIVEYLEQQISFIATNYPEAYQAYQNSKIYKTKIQEHEESIK